jgi:hypothetical protein
MLSSFEAFDQLFAERQLPVEEVAEVLADVTVRVIIHGQDAANPMGAATPSLKNIVISMAATAHRRRRDPGRRDASRRGCFTPLSRP